MDPATILNPVALLSGNAMIVYSQNLHEAVRTGEPRAVKRTLEKDALRLEEKEGMGRTPPIPGEAAGNPNGRNNVWCQEGTASRPSKILIQEE